LKQSLELASVFHGNQQKLVLVFFTNLAKDLKTMGECTKSTDFFGRTAKNVLSSGDLITLS
jgi:hypothetical protein